MNMASPYVVGQVYVINGQNMRYMGNNQFAPAAQSAGGAVGR
jgi:hypothetical protein